MLRQALALALALLSPAAHARKQSVTVPVNVGVGPAGLWITGPVADEQLFHSAVALDLYAVIDKATIHKFKNKIPKEYRKQAMHMEEIRYSPTVWVPDTIVISPATRNTGIYGASWRPLSMGIPLLSKPVRFDLNAGLRLTYLFIHSDTLPQTHFLRPGLDLKAELEVPLSKHWLFSLGWDSELYPPQELGGPVFEIGGLEDSIWHVGRAFFQIHYRFPYKVSL